MFGKLVKLKGLNGRQIAVDPTYVDHLTELDTDGRLHTNVHFHNGRFVTAAVPLDEALAVLRDKGEQDSEEDLARLRKRAESRRRAELEAQAAVTACGIDMERFKRAGYEVADMADGSKRIVVTLAPKPEGEAGER